MRNKFLGTGEPGYRPLRKLAVIASGLRFAVVYDFAVAYKVILSIAVVILAVIFRQWVDVLMVLMATGLMLMAEIFNSSLEAVCDYLQTAENEKIKAIKDMSAAATAVAIAVWWVVIAYEFATAIL
jgi:diacylglycerol kinase (ATP)